MLKKLILILSALIIMSGASSWAQSVSNSANNASNQNSQAATTAYITGAGLFVTSAVFAAQCGSQNYGACVMSAVTAAMGVLAMQQGNANSQAAGNAGTTDGETTIGAGYTTTGTTGTSTTSTSADDAASTAFQAAKNAQDALTAAGTTTTATGATAADGTTAGTSSVGSPGAMAAAGLPQSVIDAAMSAATNAEKAAEAKLKMTAGLDDGSGGGGGGSQGPAQDPDAKIYALKGKPAAPLKRNPAAQVAGLQKNYNGEPIGVAQDDIFAMMNRRYKLKDSQDSFLHENEIMLRK